MTARPGHPLYEPLDYFVVRAPLLSVERFEQLCRREPGPARLLPDDPLERRALAVGSPVLYRALTRAAGSGEDDGGLQRKLLRYLIRMSTRPTPYGLFAGVALGEWAARTDLALAPVPPTTRTRPDMAWLTALVGAAESTVEIRRAATVFAEPSAFEHGGRIHLGQRPGPSDGAPLDVSVRAGHAVRRVLALARRPVPYAELVAQVLTSLPGATPAKVHGLCDELWRYGLLRTDLHPPLTGGDPSRHVLDRLPAVPAAAAYTERLTAVLDRASAVDAAGPLAPRVAEPPPEGEEAYQVDTARPLAGRGLTRTVAAEAARAVDLLFRLHPAPGGPPELRAYRHAFEARYGHGRLVPVLELLDPRFGLGPPARYAGQAEPDPAARQARTGILATLLATAQRDRAIEVELSGQLLDDLQSWTPAPADVPPSVDLSVFLAAASTEDLDRGRYLLVIGPNLGGSAAGKGLGRFADLLGPAAHAALERAASAEGAHDQDSVRAELVYAPNRPRAANVAVRPGLGGYEIPVGVTPGCPPDRVIPPDELAVCLLGDRLRLWWPARSVEVKVCAGHMLNHTTAPVLCQFLDDIGNDGVTPLTGFDWGPFSGAPFLPRVRVGRIVLRPASWQLGPRCANELGVGPGRAKRPPAGQPAEVFATRLRAWRRRWQVPRQVYLAAGDNRLLLDLDHPAHTDQLRDEMRRQRGYGCLEEALPGTKDAWLTGAGGRYLSEVVVPLVRARTPGSPVRAARPILALEADRRRPPGSDWLFVKLYGPPSRQDSLISGPLCAFAGEALAAGDADQWFFVRYADPDPHVRVRFHGRPERLREVLLPAVAKWAGDLTAARACERFAVDVYEREIERYGGEAATRAAERLFSADSTATAALLRLLQQGEGAVRSRPTLALLTVDDLVSALGLDEDAVARMCRADDILPRESAAAFRDGKDALRTLLVDHRRGAGLAARDSELRRILSVRRDAVARVAEQIEAIDRAAGLAVPLETLARSYVHLHCNRLLGPDPQAERVALGLLRRLRSALRHRRDASDPHAAPAGTFCTVAAGHHPVDHNLRTEEPPGVTERYEPRAGRSMSARGG
jgi:thiopeptide-type bacteriocin biosynthesis protein